MKATRLRLLLRPRLLLYGAVALLYLLHNDFWLWNDSRWMLGLPVGLTYHVFYCVVVAAMMMLLVRYAWPAHLEAEAEPQASADDETAEGSA